MRRDVSSLRLVIAGCVAASVLLLSTLQPASARVAGFDCAKATTPVEKTICNHYDLGNLDRILTGLYKAALLGTEDKTALKAQQRDWTANRNQCGLKTYCLEYHYNERINALKLQAFGVFLQLPRVAGISYSYTTCMEENDGSMLPMIGCVRAEATVYEDLIREFDQRQPARSVPLSAFPNVPDTDAQTWQAQRDITVEAVHNPEGGSMARLEAASVFVELTRARLLQLRYLESLDKNPVSPFQTFEVPPPEAKRYETPWGKLVVFETFKTDKPLYIGYGSISSDPALDRENGTVMFVKIAGKVHRLKRVPDYGDLSYEVFYGEEDDNVTAIALTNLGLPVDYTTGLRYRLDVLSGPGTGYSTIVFRE